MRPPTPAAVWADRVTAARCCEERARAEADAILELPERLDDPWWSALISTRYQAAKTIERAYREYAEQCEAAFTRNADAEMAAVDAAEQRRYDNTVTIPGRTLAQDVERTFGGRSYDTPRCVHGCCPDAVCEFVGDCDGHRAGS